MPLIEEQDRSITLTNNTSNNSQNPETRILTQQTDTTRKFVLPLIEEQNRSITLTKSMSINDIFNESVFDEKSSTGKTQNQTNSSIADSEKIEEVLMNAKSKESIELFEQQLSLKYDFLFKQLSDQDIKIVQISKLLESITNDINLQPKTINQQKEKNNKSKLKSNNNNIKIPNIQLQPNSNISNSFAATSIRNSYAFQHPFNFGHIYNQNNFPHQLVFQNNTNCQLQIINNYSYAF